MSHFTTRAYLCGLVTTLAFALIACAQANTDLTGHAVELMNQSRYSEASQDLILLIRRHPREFYAYRLLWDSIAQSEGAHILHQRVLHDLDRLSKVPSSQRDEFFYEADEHGLHLVGRISEERTIHQEQLQRFPDGRAAQRLLLNKARNETDVVRSAYLFEQFAATHPHRPGSAAQALRERFYVIQSHPQNFSKAALIDAAGEWCASERIVADSLDEPLELINALREMADGFLSVDPLQTLRFAYLGTDYIAATATHNKLADRHYEAVFLAPQLQASVKSQQWQLASSFGDALAPYFLKGELPDGSLIERKQEAALRAAYGKALSMSGKPDAAYEQLGLASALNPSRLQDLAEFLKSNPRFEQPMESQQQRWQEALDHELQPRLALHRQALLETQVHLEPIPFSVQAFTGNALTLDSFHGSPLILVFWASWCHYCIQELKELDKFVVAAPSGQFRVLAISVDNDRNLARKFLQNIPLHFPLAFTDGKVDGAYRLQVMPQLNVLDSKGFVRFTLSGVDMNLAAVIPTLLQASSEPAPIPKAP